VRRGPASKLFSILCIELSTTTTLASAEGCLERSLIVAALTVTIGDFLHHATAEHYGVSPCKTWQIDVSRVRLRRDTVWDSFFQSLVTKSCRELGISVKRFQDLGVQAVLCKVLVQECGGHFAPQCNYDSATGTFATMILQLPSQFSGGALAVSNNGETKTFELSDQSGRQFKRIVFFAGCVHSHADITSGVKVCLVFSLVAVNLQSVKPCFSSSLQTLSMLQSFASSWKTVGQSMGKLGFPLEHQLVPDEYYGKNNSYQYFYYRKKHRLFGALSGHDEDVFQTLADATSVDGNGPLFDVHLVVMELKFGGMQDKVSSRSIQVYDRHGTRVDKYWEMYSHSDGWWINDKDFARLNPNYKDTTAAYWELPRYGMYFKWGDGPHLAFSDDEMEYNGTCEELFYAAGVVIALPK
jgi:hypothetical protein